MSRRLWDEADEDVGHEEVMDALSVVLKAMANGRRLALVELLAQGEHSVEDLSRLSGIGFQSTSGHLRVLKRAGLVRTRRVGTTIYHRLAGDDVAELYVVAKRVGLRRSPLLREVVGAYLVQEDEDPVPTIAPAAVTSDMTVLDVRPRAEWQAGHFPGAVSMPLDELPDRYRDLGAGRRVVLYCRGAFCRSARDGAEWLRDRGVDAVAMEDGVVEWRGTQEVVLAA